MRRAIDLAFAAARVRRVIAMEIDDVLELTRMVAVGLGVALLPPSTAAAAGLRLVPIRRHAPIHEVVVALPAVRQPSAATRTLRDVILGRPR